MCERVRQPQADEKLTVTEDNSTDAPTEAELAKTKPTETEPKATDPVDAEDAGRLTRIFDAVWNGIVLSDSKWNPEKSCFQLADEYRHSGRTPEQCVENFIDWQTAKAGVAGFALGLPGFALMPVTAPADLVSTAYLQLRMVAVIGLLFGWNPRSDQFRTIAYVSLLGSAAGEMARDFGIRATTKLAAAQLANLPGKVLIQINKAVGFRLVTKAGTKGLVNLTKLVPILGGLIGGGINIVVTNQIGMEAARWLKEGPPPNEPPSDAPIISAQPGSSQQPDGLPGDSRSARQRVQGD